MKSLLLTVLTCLLLTSGLANAEQKVTRGNWDIHYIAFPSSFVKPETAREYNLERSRYMAIINISVLDKDSQKAQNVNVMGTARNLLGQTTRLEFKRVQEGEAIYYLAQLKYSNEEIFNFNIDVQHGNNKESFKFKKKLYVD